MATYNQVPTNRSKTNPTETAESFPPATPRYPGALPASDLPPMWVEGLHQLPPRHLEKLDQKIREIDDAEQYALIAQVFGWYECFGCPNDKVYLAPGQVWKYGVTRKGERVRHGLDYAIKNNLSYVIQFRGDIGNCLIQKKIKIYHYPLLPENLQRPDALRLARPPGNKQDN